MNKMRILLFLFAVGNIYHTNAQNQKFATLATIGVTSPILDNGIGLTYDTPQYLILKIGYSF
jgi:hypothetical protein